MVYIDGKRDVPRSKELWVVGLEIEYRRHRHHTRVGVQNSSDEILRFGGYGDVRREGIVVAFNPLVR